MCGIVAYVGDKPCRQYILEGLARLEYRGYDSAGIVCIDNKTQKFRCHKEVGEVAILKHMLESITFDGGIGMGHTRWATHGVVDKANTHPHFSCDKDIAVVHNGIVESFELIKKKLIADGHYFSSTTDTEVIAHLFESSLSIHKSILAATLATVSQLDGSYACAIALETEPEKLILIRKGSPMVIGIGQNEMFIASDFLAFADHTNVGVFMPDESFAIVHKNKIELYDFKGGVLPVVSQEINHKFIEIDKQGFEHYMLKEIYEQKRSITRTISFCNVIGSGGKETSEAHTYNDYIWRQLGLTVEQVIGLKNINLIGAGTSWHAARIAQFFFELIAQIPTHVYLASEFRYMPFFAEKEKDGAFIFISQSGETADTLGAMRLVNSFEIPTVTLSNVASSTMVREASGFLPMQAGPEISVASTKAFSTQVATMYWLANRLALERGLINAAQMRKAEEDLLIAAEVLETAIETYKLIISTKLAAQYAKFDRFIFLGRHISYPFAMEAALKLKEISYIFAQCYPAGELKHGPIALVDEKTPVILFSCLDDIIYSKMISNAQEVKARKGHLISFVFEHQTELIELSDFAFVIPNVKPLLAPLAMTGLMQFFVYQITRELGNPIDKPRNLAKSVTVE
jgi:glucosamine--fructose-6-phosphate aminotransferase (isomerizing)